ncbi:Sulfotransferase family protein [Promicromonospora umidemergens]|uniref:sulfotransferase family protein n=1 Tax=Promicromonospora umidemergens TaxID=629679 RepID=UPI002646EFE0|nr:sulfotransferase [Promicromonospora umidemergens]MCP2283467.1 Sulfotransferase family protein [Promicromonospora umidemergens]
MSGTSTSSTPWNDRRITFVGGLHRSGTTLVARTIGASADASVLTRVGTVLDEGQQVQDIYADSLGNTSEWSFHPQAHLTEEDARRVPDAGARLWQSWSPYWDLDRTVLVEKSPPNLTKMRYFQEIFPKARFIVVTRHPVVQALAVRKWATRTRGRFTYGFPRLVEHWVHAHDVFAEDALHIENLLVLRYEHLMRDPAQELGRVEKFLGIELDAEAVGAVDAGRSNRYAELWQTGGRGQLAGRFRSHVGNLGSRSGTPRADLLRDVTDAALLPRYRNVVNEHLGDRIRAHGYDLSTLDEAAPWAPVLRGVPAVLATDTR